jgi:hypothetical protein
VDDLPHFIQLLIDLRFRLFYPALAQVDGIGQDRATLLDRLRVAAFLEFKTLGLQEPTQVFV